MYDLSNMNALKLSINDDDMPINLLSDVLNFHLELSEKVTAKLYDDVLNQVGESKLDCTKKESQKFVVDIDDDTLKDIKEGKIKLVKEKGQFFAQLKEDGKYSRKLPIREEIFKDDLGDLKLDYALQMQSLKDSLDAINDKLNLMDQKIRDVINGQQNDRIALYYSGASLFAESLTVSNEGMKQLLFAQSVKSLTESLFKLTLTMNEDILFLKNKEYKNNKKKSYALVHEKMNSIKQCYSIIHKSFILKSAIYAYYGEMKAAIGTLKEYSNFINEYIVQNNTMLVQLDSEDNGTENGIWKSKITLDKNVQNVVSKLSLSNDVFYLESKVEEK